MKILIACEKSGKVREAFRKKGHDVISCDLLPTDIEGNHFMGDVMEIINDGFDLLIGFPPCTFISNSGVRWLHTDPERLAKMQAGAAFFMKLYNSSIPHICLENPVPHPYANLPRKTQAIQPYHFGHTSSKRTCLWLKGLPLLRRVTKRPKIITFDVLAAAPGIERGAIRSETFQGVADAMADQWGTVPLRQFNNYRQTQLNF